MKQKRRIMVLVMLILTSAFLSGWVWNNKETVMDVDKIFVYRNEPVEYFLIRSASNSDGLKEEYQNQYFMMYGRLRSKSSDHSKVEIGMTTVNSPKVLSCTTSDEDVIASIADMRIGDLVKVYGKLTVGLLDGKWTMTIHKIEKTYEKSVSRSAYSVLSGKTVDKETAEKRVLNDGAITYYIPTSWKTVEKDLYHADKAEDKLATMECYQYRLNEIDRQAVEPESLFVCYFDNDTLLLRKSDKGRTEQIEKTILDNILKSPEKKIIKKTASYGANYHYYSEAYTNNGPTYHAEFIFQPVNTEGFVIYIYICKNKPQHLDEIMTMLRMVEVQQ